MSEKKVVSTQKVYCETFKCDAIVIIYEDGSYDVICPKSECKICSWSRKM